MSESTATHEEGSLPSGQYWQGWTLPDPGGVVVFVHGLHEHGARYRHVAERLAASGYASFVADLAGHGRSAGVRGNIGSMAATVDGVAQTVALARGRFPGVPAFVYGHSMGGLIALQYLSGTPDDALRGAVISAPAVDTSAANGVQRAAAGVLSRFLPDVGVLQLDADAVSRDPAVVADYKTDPLNYGGKVRARTGSEMMRTAAALPDRLPRLTLPLLVIHGGADRLVPTASSEVVPARAGSTDVTRTVHPGLFHEPHNEPEQEQVLADVVSWLDAHR